MAATPAAWDAEPPLAVVLHISRRLPDSLGQLRQLRARDADLPLVVVCQQLRDLDHVLALEMGADDVLDAATGSAVIAARLRALARRHSQANNGLPKALPPSSGSKLAGKVWNEVGSLLNASLKRHTLRRSTRSSTRSGPTARGPRDPLDIIALYQLGIRQWRQHWGGCRQT